MIMLAIKLILMVTGVCVWMVLFIIAGGFVVGAIINKIYQYKKKIKVARMERERIDSWVSRRRGLGTWSVSGAKYSDLDDELND